MNKIALEYSAYTLSWIRNEFREFTKALLLLFEQSKELQRALRKARRREKYQRRYARRGRQYGTKRR